MLLFSATCRDTCWTLFNYYNIPFIGSNAAAANMDHIFARFAAEIATGFPAHFAFTACCGTEAQILLSPTIKLQIKAF